MEFTSLQQKFIAGYAKTPLVKRFYLTGGTLLAARYLHHRRSLDLDFFTDTKFTLSEIEPHVREITRDTKIEVKEFKRVADRYEWEIADAGARTRVEFVWYDFKPLCPHRRWQGIAIDTLEDMTANKVIALLERHEPKDVYDLYFIFQKTGATIAKAIRLMKRKFGLTITPQTFFAEAEIALKRLDAVRGLLLIDGMDEQNLLFGEIHDYFDERAWRYLRSQFVR